MASELLSFRDIRKAQGLRLVDVAERAGMSAGMVSMVENGLRPSPRTGAKLAGVLGRVPQDFWEGM